MQLLAYYIMYDLSRPKTNKVDVVGKQLVSKHKFDTNYVIRTYLGISFNWISRYPCTQSYQVSPK